MKTFIKKANNQIYIVDVDEKVVITLSQINIDNLWEKYLEALAEKESNKYVHKQYNFEEHIKGARHQNFEDGYLQAKKETCFSEQDLRSLYFSGLGMNNFDKALEELKISKIPECSVEIGMGLMKLNDDGQEYGFPDMSMPKLTNNKVTITKIIL